MKTNFFVKYFLITAVILSLSACFNQGTGDAEITISLNSSGAGRAAFAEGLKENNLSFTHEIVFSNSKSGEEFTEILEPGELSVKVKVTPGNWDIYVLAYDRVTDYDFNGDEPTYYGYTLKSFVTSYYDDKDVNLEFGDFLPPIIPIAEGRANQTAKAGVSTPVGIKMKPFFPDFKIGYLDDDEEITESGRIIVVENAQTSIDPVSFFIYYIEDGKIVYGDDEEPIQFPPAIFEWSVDSENVSFYDGELSIEDGLSSYFDGNEAITLTITATYSGEWDNRRSKYITVTLQVEG